MPYLPSSMSLSSPRILPNPCHGRLSTAEGEECHVRISAGRQATPKDPLRPVRTEADGEKTAAALHRQTLRLRHISLRQPCPTVRERRSCAFGLMLMERESQTKSPRHTRLDTRFLRPFLSPPRVWPQALKGTDHSNLQNLPPSQFSPAEDEA